MKLFSFAKQFMFLALSVVLFTACKKTKDANEVFGGGSTIVQLLDAGPDASPVIATNAIDFLPDPQTIIGADIRRDVTNTTELNKTMIVMVLDDTAAVTAAGLVHLPDDLYTVGSATPKIAGAGGVDSFYKATMNPGEVAKLINITVPDATKLDPSTAYGLGFKIMSVDAGGKISEAARSIVVSIGAKNIYDGIYKVTGLFKHPIYGPGAGQTLGTPAEGPLEVAMITTGANTCSRLGVAPGDIAGYDGFIFWLTPANGGPGYTGFSNVFPVYSIDPGTNVVTVSGGPGNSVTWNNYGSSYNPVTKSFDIKSGYNNTRFINETWTYLRPR